MKPVTAVLSALAEEQSGLHELLVNPERLVHAGREFWSGELHGHPVVLGLSRIGKVAAATTATTMITRMDVQRMVFTGVAGGLAAGVNVGDVVVASEFVQHDLDASPIFPRFEVPLYGRTTFQCDDALTVKLLSASRSALATLERSGAQVHTGLIASGDQFVSSSRESLRLQQDLCAAQLQALAVEMEGAAVAQVCFDFGLPFAAVRTISDRADDEAHADFPKFVNEVASVYAQSIVKQLLLLL